MMLRISGRDYDCDWLQRFKTITPAKENGLTKGANLAGGKGARLYPFRCLAHEHPLFLKDRSVVLDPIQTAVDAGILDIIVVTAARNSGRFQSYTLKNGKAASRLVSDEHRMARLEQDKNISEDYGKFSIMIAETTTMRSSKTALTKRWLLFTCWIVLSSLLYRIPLVAFVRMSLSHDDASYLVLIPFISAWVLFVERHKIFLDLSYDKIFGGSFLFLAGSAALASRLVGGASSLGLQLSGYILSLVLVWVGGFAILFGKSVSKAAYFPLLFLFLMVPLPDFLLDQVIYLLQVGSAWITGAFFDLLGVPALRDGLVFHLARVNIEVAKECSGIRSSMAMLILTLLIAHFCLRSLWKKFLFVACGLFMMILKNGIRIATLTLLAMYVNPGFLYGRLHHQGGIVFFLLSLLLLAPLLWWLQHGDALPAKDIPVPPAQPASKLPST